jgi:hypothetical protein
VEELLDAPARARQAADVALAEGIGLRNHPTVPSGCKEWSRRDTEQGGRTLLIRSRERSTASVSASLFARSAPTEVGLVGPDTTMAFDIPPAPAGTRWIIWVDSGGGTPAETCTINADL